MRGRKMSSGHLLCADRSGVEKASGCLSGPRKFDQKVPVIISDGKCEIDFSVIKEELSYGLD